MKLGLGFFSLPGTVGALAGIADAELDGPRLAGSAAAPDGLKTMSGSIGDSEAAFSRRENFGGKTPS
jgi:hypothetical protein